MFIEHFPPMLGPGNGTVTTNSMVDFTSTAEYEHEGNSSPHVEHGREKAQSLKGAYNTGWGGSPSVPSLLFHDSGLQVEARSCVSFPGGWSSWRRYARGACEFSRVGSSVVVWLCSFGRRRNRVRHLQ